MVISTLQLLCFCIVKAQQLQGKSITVARQKHNSCKARS